MIVTFLRETEGLHETVYIFLCVFLALLLYVFVCTCVCVHLCICVCVCLFVQVDDAVFCAGQIALVPCSMQLVAGGAALQAQLCFSHMAHVLEAVSSSLTLRHALQAHCYVTQPGHVPAVRATWQRILEHGKVR